MRWLPAGPAGLLLELESGHQVRAVYAALAALEVPAVDVVPAARTVLFDGVTDPEDLRRVVEPLLGAGLTTPDPAGPEVEVPVRYDGEDLEEVARTWGMTRAEAVATHTGTAFVVAFCGFAPGFAYCTGLPQELHVPRRRSPRTRVPAGSVGLAGEFTGVYPSPSPGGWRLLGVTDLPLWDETVDPPAVLSPGTPVRFTEVGP